MAITTPRLNCVACFETKSEQNLYRKGQHALIFRTRLGAEFLAIKHAR